MAFQPTNPQAVSKVIPKTDRLKAAELAEQQTQQIRAEERRIDLENSGLKWMPWSLVGKTTQDFIRKSEPNFKSLIGVGRYVDAAAYDFDLNGQPDIILYFWGDCGNQGCLYKIYFDRLNKPTVGFIGRELVPYKKGIMVDRAYFSL